MNVLLDTNIVTRLAQAGGHHGPAAAAAVSVLIARGEALNLVPQNLYEFWVVATRPLADNGLAMTAAEAKARLDDARAVATVLPDDAAVTAEWERLVVQHDTKGKAAHDARLVAAMNVHGITHLLTFNARDFLRYPGITVLDPLDLAQQAAASPEP